MFVLSSDIAIGNFRFSGVNEVQIKRSLRSIVDTAIIRIPSIARIISNNKVTSGSIIAGKQFSDGDPITIRLGYNGEMQTEFIGFVKHRNLNMPLEVECEGYSWLLKRNTINEFYKSVSVKDLLNRAVLALDAPYTIKVQCEVDIKLTNITIDNLSGFEVVNSIAKYTDNCLTCFFIEHDTLWCGFVYTPFADGSNVLNSASVKYELGFNVRKDNELKVRTIENDPVEVRYIKKNSSGIIVKGSSDVFKNFKRTHTKLLNHLDETSALRQLANEKAYKLNYAGYEGDISAFLQPYAAPGYSAYIKDDRYPERTGTYIVESTEVYFGVNGARRIVEIGPRLGFAKE